jgi:hypothetical protein
MAFMDQYNFLDLGIFGLFETNPPFDPLRLSTIDESLCASLYVSLFLTAPLLLFLCLVTFERCILLSHEPKYITANVSQQSFNTPTLSNSNQFQPLTNVQTFGLPTPPLDYHMSVIPPQDIKIEKSRKKKNASREELIVDPHDDKHLARMLSRKRAQNRAA